MYSLNIGGAEKVLADLSIEYAKEHDVTLVLFDSSLMFYPYAGKLVDLNLPVKNGTINKFINMLHRAWRLRRFFHAQQFDRIISFMENANFPAIMANKNVIASNHCNPNHMPPVEWLLAKWLYPRAKKIVAVSKAGAEIFKERLHIDNITYLHNPISLKRIAELSAQSIENKPEKDYLIAVGRLSPEKNFSSLIAAFAGSGLSDQYQLLILGEGDERTSLTEQIDKAGLQKSIRLMGFVGNPYPYLSQAKCLVLSSLHEGFPVILAEALACGCPVIATRCETGPEEIITHEKNGLLVPVNDTPALSEAIQRLLNDKALYQRIKENTKPSARHLDIGEVAKRWLEL